MFVIFFDCQGVQQRFDARAWAAPELGTVGAVVLVGTRLVTAADHGTDFARIGINPDRSNFGIAVTVWSFGVDNGLLGGSLGFGVERGVDP